jgi:vacuolar-type H+-ATPase subunit I/STV1
MVDEARRREEDALSLLREELQAKAAENKSLQVHGTFCFSLGAYREYSFFQCCRSENN